MRRRLLTPILTLVLVLAAFSGAVATQTPVAPAGAGWEAEELRQLESGDDEYVTLSPDGARIAGIGTGGGLCVWDVEDLDGSCTEDVGPVRAESIVWSPDGTAVAFSLDHVVLLAESDIFVYEVADGTLHNLTDDGHDGALVASEPGVLVDGVPVWSPDSRELAFVRSQPSDATFGTVIMRIDRIGGEPSRVHRLPLETPYGIFMPMHWLPDDSLLYTQVALDGADPGDGVWRVGLDGGDARHLLPGARGTEVPGPMLMDVVPESGLALVYAALFEPAAQFEVPEEPQVWLLDIDSGEATPVPNLPSSDGEDAAAAGRAQYAVFSPDGSAFLSVYSSVTEGTVLAVTDVATGAVAVVASDVPARAGRTLPTWSDDRVLLPERDRATLVTLVAPAEAGASPVASPAANDPDAGGWSIAETRRLDIESRYPVLSPDGTMLAGVDGDGYFCVWDVVTLSPECVEERLPIREGAITWSPDGTAVAFPLDAVYRGYESDIYVFELATGALTNITDDGVEGSLLDTFDFDPPADDVPAWSPDSQQLIFVRSLRGDDDPGTTTIMQIDRAGGEPIEVLPIDVEQPFAIWMPMFWLPDGTLLYAQSANQLDDPRNGIWKVGMEDGSSPLQIAPGADTSESPGAMLVGVDAERGQAIVFSLMLANQFGAGEGQLLYWLVDIATGERESFPALPADDGSAPVVLDVAYAPDGSAILLATLTADGVELVTMD
ncbi:MAG TPA: hypothetical protein VD789_02385, partial [Thermomicrobiales bacterium]|nr:hypothetical protein [Thermomicrobiales bacterium]